jgi:hypothetical protein
MKTTLTSRNRKYLKEMNKYSLEMDEQYSLLHKRVFDEASGPVALNVREA